MSLYFFKHGSRSGQLPGRRLSYAIDWTSKAVIWHKPLLLLSHFEKAGSVASA
ncbi:hypothetical protein ABIE27_006069 [Paenibacillus sp. 4624]|uniref:hypothetical protein n=1 Tax=Paenibacillus TaxID=44249 RepID=UPI001374BCB6|nr:hypothetical protein [Paenibacillus amylolyticus]